MCQEVYELAQELVTVCSMCGNQMSDSGWRPGDVKQSNALFDGAITDGDTLMLP